MKFSIVIPTYNRGHILQQTLNGVLHQSYTNFEIIVVDDGSTDMTQQIIQSFNDPRIKYIHKQNEERSIARNLGVKHATGDYVNFLDSDDSVYPHHLQMAQQVILENKFPPVFHLAFDVKDHDENLLFEKNEILVSKNLLYGNPLSCNGVFIKRDISLENPFYEDLRLITSEDYFLWLTLDSKYKILHIPVISSTIIEHKQRSIHTVNIEKIIESKELFAQLLQKESFLNGFYQKNKHILLSSIYSFIALHISMKKQHKKLALHYFFKAIFLYPFCIKKRRFWVVCKYLVQ